MRHKGIKTQSPGLRTTLDSRSEGAMAQSTRNKTKSFKIMLEKYLKIKGLDIILVLEDGKEIELYKNRSLVDDMVVTFDTKHPERRIPLASIKSVDLYAA